MPDPSPSETLRAAAVRIRDPYDQRALQRLLRRAAVRLREGSPLVSPVVAEPLAAWLCQEADWHDTQIFRTSTRHHALAFARSILEQP